MCCMIKVAVKVSHTEKATSVIGPPKQVSNAVVLSVKGRANVTWQTVPTWHWYKF